MTQLLTPERAVSRHLRNTYSVYKDRPSNCRAILAMLAAQIGNLPQVRAMCCDFSNRRKYKTRPMLTLHKGKPSVYLLGWRENEYTDIHDHGDCEVGVYVIQGTVVEDIYAAPPRGRDRDISLAWSRFLSAGQMITCPKQYIHQVGNPFPEVAATLHVYGPALSEMNLFSVVRDVLVNQGCWGCDDSNAPH